MEQLRHSYRIENNLVAIETLMAWQDEMLNRMAAADRAARRYTQRKPRIVEHIERLHQSDFARRQALSENWTLNDALKEHAWNRDEANRLNLAIIAQHALQERMRSAF